MLAVVGDVRVSIVEGDGVNVIRFIRSWELNAIFTA